MNDATALTLLYAVACVILVLEIFIPSQGILTIVGLGTLIAAIVITFQTYGSTGGMIALVASLIVIPAAAIVTVQIFPHTAVGRRVVPPNPVYTRSDFGVDTSEMEAVVGKVGRSLTPLRPVGACEFDGRRLECLCDSGMIDAGCAVRAVGLRGRLLEVAELREAADA